MCGVVNRGRRSSSPGFQRKRYGFQVTPSSLPSTMISGRSVVITANRPYELVLRNGSTHSLRIRVGTGHLQAGPIVSSISTVVTAIEIAPVTPRRRAAA